MRSERRRLGVLHHGAEGLINRSSIFRHSPHLDLATFRPVHLPSYTLAVNTDIQIYQMYPIRYSCHAFHWRETHHFSVIGLCITLLDCQHVTPDPPVPQVRSYR
jgi:hypothetical protein